jgi:hypothetical protein
MLMTLFIGTVIFPVTGNTLFQNNLEFAEVLDQRQESDPDCIQIFYPEWQQFKPTKEKLVRVEVKISQTCPGCPDLNMEIQKPLGTVLTSTSVPATSIPSGSCNCDWVSFDIPDINVIPGEVYHIVLYYIGGAEYYWCGSYDNPYPRGRSSVHPDFDYCFRTFAEMSTNNPPNKPMIDGPNSGNAGTTYNYRFSTTDPDGDDVYYWIEWFYGCPGIFWDGPYGSGDEIIKPYTYENRGTFTITVIARDVFDAESEPATFTVTMPRNSVTNRDLYSILSERFPIICRLIEFLG